MKLGFTELRWLLTTLCVLAMFSTFVVNFGVHSNMENKEIVELEELEAVEVRRAANRRESNASIQLPLADHLQKPLFPAKIPFQVRTERGRFNGLGTYLLT